MLSRRTELCDWTPQARVKITNGGHAYLTFTSVLVPGLERNGTAACADLIFTRTLPTAAAEPSGDADAHSLVDLLTSSTSL